jgi:3-methyladenine DNA glycosylase AlkD
VTSPTAEQVLAELRSYANPANIAGMARFGIRGATVLGGPTMPTIRRIGKRLGRDTVLAVELWGSGIHEARLLATLVADPRTFPREQAEAWALDLDSWDVCDQLCGNLLDRTPFADDLVADWTGRPEEFVKRAGFALIAEITVHDKAAPDERLAGFLPLIVREAPDRRNFVRKAVSWALREIGKRNLALNGAAIEAAHRVREGPREGRWVAGDALRELTGAALQTRLRERALRASPLGSSE